MALGVLACLSAPVSPVPGSKPASRQPSPTSTDGTIATIDPKVISIGDMQAGDNWPSTWANDDNVYTYMSDGTGFGFSSARSMAPAKILGNPSAGGISGQNISTNCIGMSTGGGSSGKKVSGLISLPDSASPSGQVLYAWVRNITSNGDASIRILVLTKDVYSPWEFGETPVRNSFSVSLISPASHCEHS